MGDHNRQYVIELDGNLPHKVLFEQLQIKLETYTAGHAIAPVVLLNSDEDELNEDMDDVMFMYFGFIIVCLHHLIFIKECLFDL